MLNPTTCAVVNAFTCAVVKFAITPVPIAPKSPTSTAAICAVVNDDTIAVLNLLDWSVVNATNWSVVNAFTWENKENGKGISFGVSMIQKAKDGERLGGGGGVDVDKWAEKIDDEGEAPAETKTGQGAGGLFG